MRRLTGVCGLEGVGWGVGVVEGGGGSSVLLLSVCLSVSASFYLALSRSRLPPVSLTK